MILLAAWIVSAAAADGFAGLSWTPLSRADLVWVADDRTTGTGVGEFDGTTRPSLQPFGGAWFDRVGLVASIGVARLTASTTADGVRRQRHWGVIRPGVDLRVALVERTIAKPIPWAVVGVAGSVPSARDVSNGFTDAEQTEADRAAQAERVRLGGIGARLGAGLDYALLPHLSLGAELSLEWYTSTLRTADAVSASTWLGSRGSLLLTFDWGTDP
ncbi:MAG: hypothetical protein KC912_05770 [Proteobacteria bacterium]|nr:hypothetical protein [Pseudomonadota bacterium]